MIHSTSPSYSITIRIEFDNRIGMFAQIAGKISEAGGDLGAVNIVRVTKGRIVRDVTVNARDDRHEKQIVRAIHKIPTVKILRVMDRTFTAHQGGKIEIRSRMPIRDSNELSKVYTPGVARICMDIYKNHVHAYRYTIKGNSVAIVTDGTAVLGLGDVGPMAAMPVMEGKAMIFKEFAGIDAMPVALNTTDPDQIINTVCNISPAFGGINLEDISAPRCFEIERQLRKRLNIPVIHDDQHGTAVVILAALINVSRLLRKPLRNFRIVISGAGAAGAATARILSSYGVKDLIVCDRRGAIYRSRRAHMDSNKRRLARETNSRNFRGSVSEALAGADVFIGLSGPGVVSIDDLRKMRKNPVIFALANPEPEVSPDEAISVARILATGRSDYPNQINNMLSFPGIFRGLLDAKAKGIDESIKFAAARAIADVIKDDELHEDYIIPSIFDRKVVSSVAHAVAESAIKAGLAH